jgi:hypothetical protein
MQQGVYRGNNVPCSAAQCGTFAATTPTTGFDRIPGDWNGDGHVNAADITEYMNAYAAGLGDLNGDGVCDARDIARFLSMFYGTGSK